MVTFTPVAGDMRSFMANGSNDRSFPSHGRYRFSLISATYFTDGPEGADSDHLGTCFPILVPGFRQFCDKFQAIGEGAVHLTYVSPPRHGDLSESSPRPGPAPLRRYVPP